MEFEWDKFSHQDAKKSFQVLYEVSSAVNSSNSLDELYRSLHISLAKILNAQNLSILLYHKEKDTVTAPYFIDSMEDDFGRISNNSKKMSLTAKIINGKEAFIATQSQLNQINESKSWIGAPLKIRNRVIGALVLQSYTTENAYKKSDLALLDSISGVIALAIDQKQTENKLRESEKKYQHLFNNVPAGMYEIDFVKQKFVEVNRVLCEYTGYSEDEFLSMNPFDLLTDKSKKQFIEQYKIILKGGKLSGQVEYGIIIKNGKILNVLLHADSIYKKGRLIGARVVAHDITERKKIEDMIIQSEKMMSVGGLAAGMAHEINNPLAGMMQNAQVVQNRLSKDLPANHKAAEELGTSMAVIKAFMHKREILDRLENINTAGARAAKIIDNMLSFSKKGVSTKQKTKLDELIDKTIELIENDYDLKNKFDFKKVKIIREYSPDVPKVLCEESKIQQVLFNVIKNAFEAMRQDEQQNHVPTIIFRLGKSEHQAYIEIEDNGPGIDTETKKRIFEPFFTTKSVDTGTGLGLSVSYFIIVDDHKGEMQIKSILGKGTTFIIKLPL